jgi:hypothetical protein
MSRRVGAWLVAAVVTLALVAGGVLVASGGRDRSPAVLPAPDLSATQGAAAADAATKSGRGGVEPALAPDDSPLFWPPVTYKLGGPLPDLPDEARAWKVGTDLDPDRVATLAAALGLRGRPKEESSSWTVRDGRRALVVHRLAGLPWSYDTAVTGACVAANAGGPDRAGGIRCPAPDTAVSNQPAPANPAGAGGAAGGGSTGSSGSGSASSPGSAGTGKPVKPVPLPKPWTRRPELPSREQAERVARELAGRAGLELDGASVRIHDAYAARLVTISPAVDGRPTAGFAWTVSVGPGDSVQHAGGWLATPEPADTYPLIGVGEGFERLRRIPQLHALRETPPAIAKAPCPPAGKLPCPGRPLPTRVATVTGVRLGLQLVPALPSGDRPARVGYLLPAYLFELEGGWTDVRSVIAVQDRYLTKPSKPQPPVAPGPQEPAPAPAPKPPTPAP